MPVQKHGLVTILTLAILLGGLWAIDARAEEAMVAKAGDTTRLAVVWTSGDPDMANRVCFMYTHAAAKNKWFDEVRIIVWGPSAQLLADNQELQTKLKAMQNDGVILQACIQCADSYGVTDVLRGLGIEVKGMGKPLTDLLLSDCKVLTF